MDEDRFDDEKIEQGVRMILEGIGEDPNRGGLRETPSRVARMYREVFAGIGQDASQLVTVVEGADHDEMIMVRDIPIYSMCAPPIPFAGRHVRTSRTRATDRICRGRPRRRPARERPRCRAATAQTPGPRRGTSPRGVSWS
jgi:hypothetical protein